MIVLEFENAFELIVTILVTSLIPLASIVLFKGIKGDKQ